MRRKPSLRHCPVLVKSSIRPNLVRAIILIVRVAVDTSQIRSYLSSNTDPIANFDCFDVLANFDGFAYYLMSDADG